MLHAQIIHVSSYVKPDKARSQLARSVAPNLRAAADTTANRTAHGIDVDLHLLIATIALNARLAVLDPDRNRVLFFVHIRFSLIRFSLRAVEV